MKALVYAAQKHGDQKYGDNPYKVHLIDVISNTIKFWEAPDGVPVPCDVLEAAALHDVLEDTSVTPQEISRHFGESVCGIVQLLTDKPGRNRKERHAATYPMIAADPLASYIKVCDRIANTESCLKERKWKLLAMYREEYRYFRDTLYKEGQCRSAWKYLDFLNSIDADYLYR